MIKQSGYLENLLVFQNSLSPAYCLFKNMDWVSSGKLTMTVGTLKKKKQLRTNDKTKWIPWKPVSFPKLTQSSLLHTQIHGLSEFGKLTSFQGSIFVCEGEMLVVGGMCE